MNTRTIVAFTDLSETGEVSLERAASLAAHRGYALRIIYAAEKNIPMQAGPIARLGLCARQLARRYNLPVEAAQHIVISQAELIDAASAAQFVVTGLGAETWLSSFWKNTVVDQLMRNCHCPILVVRTAVETPYGRMLVGVDFGDGSKELVESACGVIPDAELHLFHAIGRSDEAKLRSSDASVRAIRMYRSQVSANAQERLFRLADSLDTRRNRVMFFVGYGDPALQISVQQEAIAADLVVVGKQRQSALREMFVGSVARRLVHIADSDVLVVPAGS
ncbi:MAG: universal stress protein [Pseudomonadota bacterium]